MSSSNIKGIDKNAIPAKAKTDKDNAKKVEDKKFTSPEWDSYPPRSLKKLLVNEYPSWLGSWILPPG